MSPALYLGVSRQFRNNLSLAFVKHIRITVPARLLSLTTKFRCRMMQSDNFLKIHSPRADALVCFHGAGCANGVWLRRPSLLIEVKSRWFSPWGTIFGHVGASYASVHADRLERTDRRGFLHLRTRYWRDGRFRLSEAGIKSIVAAIEAHRNPAAAWPLWFGVAVLVVGALAALSFIRRSEDLHSHLK